MKKKIIFVTVIIVICFLGLLLLIKNEASKVTKTAILKQDNLNKYEEKFQQKFSITPEDAKYDYSIKDITQTDLNNAYRDGVLIQENIHNDSVLINLQEKEEVSFGFSYKIPPMYIGSNSSVLFANENGQYWTVEEEGVKITFICDVITKDIKEEIPLKIELWRNGNFTDSSECKIDDGKYFKEMWSFKGENFYPRIETLEDIIILNGEIIITRDDAAKLVK